MELFLPIAHMDVNILLILMYGGLVGFLSGLVGVGGGFLITPLLIFTGVPPIVAVSSGATQMAGTAAGASYIQWRYGHIDFRMALVLLAGSWLGGGGGVYLAKVLVHGGQFGNVVTFLYVVLLGFVGIGMLMESLRAVVRVDAPNTAVTGGTSTRPTRMQKLAGRLPLQMEFRISGVRMSVVLPLLLGAGVGVLTSLMGVGGGFIMVPVMIYLLKMPTKIVIGTSMFQLLFTTAAVSIMQAGVNHSVDPFLAVTLILGSVFGTSYGSKLGARMRAEKLRLILALVIVGVAIKMVMLLVIPPGEIYEMFVWVG